MSVRSAMPTRARQHTGTVADQAPASACACGGPTKAGCTCPPADERLAPMRVAVSFASVPTVRLRPMAVGSGGGERDDIHQPMLDDYRQRHGQPPGGVDASGTQVGPTDAELKYSGLLALESFARWLSPTFNHRNLARIQLDSQALMGGAAGLTTQFVNGRQVTSDADVEAAIPEPPISTEVAGGQTSCWFGQPVRPTGNTVMDILSPGPWRLVVPKAEAGTKTASPRCQGAGDTTVSVRSRPDDKAMEDGVRRGEQEHEDDSRAAFLANVGRYAENVNARNGTAPIAKERAATADACRVQLRNRANRALLTQFVLDLNARTAIRHAGGRHGVGRFQIDVNSDCSAVTYHVDAPRL